MNFNAVILTAIVVNDGIKEQWENEGGLAHQMLLVQLFQLLVLSLQFNFSAFSKRDRTHYTDL